jgi:hypothetical protein
LAQAFEIWDLEGRSEGSMGQRGLAIRLPGDLAVVRDGTSSSNPLQRRLARCSGIW